MNKNVGASFGLSVLIVVFFAVILYQPDLPVPTVAAVAPGEPLEAHPPEPSPTRPTLAPAPAVSNARPVALSDSARLAKVARPVSRRSELAGTVEPRGAFTTVRDGETLADVARRVYGREEASKTLWLANRDRLDRADSQVAPGSILRTP